MKAVTGIALVSLACLGGAGDERKPARKPSTYTDALYGFRIQAPGFPEAPKASTVIPVMFFGPAEGGFSSNVNVLVQLVKMTRDQYLDLSLRQFKARGCTINAVQKIEVSGKEAIRFDYQGKLGARDLRWLALAVLDEDKIFLVTCTTTQEGFEKHEKEFQACVGSFELVKQEPPQPVAAP